ncbi:DJ-1/PfpI family protein [Candidatus Woesearchaeota archaeon]|nr:DJ-1/PfpI family protein [Candidatus Woesearchaeota archaeon]
MKRWLVLSFLVVLLLFTSSCSFVKEYIETGDVNLSVLKQKENVTVEAHNDRILFIIAQNSFRDEELAKPKQILKSAGYNNQDVASITTEHALGMLGTVVKPDTAVKDVNINNYNLVVVVGGIGAMALADDPDVINLLIKAKNQSKKIAAICLGPVALAKAGLLNGMNATVFQAPESMAALIEGNAAFIDKSVVVDDWLVTANGPSTADEFGNELVKLLEKQ